MFRLLTLFLIIAVCIGLGPLLVGHQGRVIIETESIEIITSITVLCMVVLLLILCLFFLQWIIKRIYRITSATKGWFIGRPHLRAVRQTRAGLLRFIEGDYARAERLFSLAASHADQPMINHLLAAEAAQRRNNIQSANNYLEQANLSAGKEHLPVEITRARIQLAHHAYNDACHTLEPLLANQPSQPELLHLAYQAYLKTNSYEKLLALIPFMRKISLYDENRINEIELTSYQGIMNKCIETQGNQGLKQWMSALPRSQRNNIDINTIAARLFIEHNDSINAEHIIIENLKRQYHEPLVKLIPKLKSEHPETLLKLLQKLINKHGETPLLNSVMGNILMQDEKWQEAREYLQKAIAYRSDVHDYLQLAKTYEHLSQPDLAKQTRQKGLELIQ